VRTAATLCVEVGAHLSVLITPPQMLVMSPLPIGDCVPEWHVGSSQAIAKLNNRFRQIDRFTQDVARQEKRSQDIQKLLRAMCLSYDVDTDYCDATRVGEVVR
ncbi:MAG: universal stress protein, partial [Mesorhizobium sp.]